MAYIDAYVFFLWPYVYTVPVPKTLGSIPKTGDFQFDPKGHFRVRAIVGPAKKFFSRLLIDCQWFFETAGESDRQSERGIAAIQIVFLSLVRDKVVLKKAGLDFWSSKFQWISTHMCTKTEVKVEEELVQRSLRHDGMEKACTSVEVGS